MHTSPLHASQVGHLAYRFLTQSPASRFQIQPNQFFTLIFGKIYRLRYYCTRIFEQQLHVSATSIMYHQIQRMAMKDEQQPWLSG